MEDAWLPGLEAFERDEPCLPVDIVSGEQGDVGLARPQVPGDLIEEPPFGVRVGGDDPFVLAAGDSATLPEANRRPLAARDNRTRQPIEIKNEILELAQVQ